MKKNKFKISNNTILALIERDETDEYDYRVSKSTFDLGADKTSQFVDAIIENL